MFVQRVIPDCGELFSDIQKHIEQVFWPALFGTSVINFHKVFTLPSRLAGLGIRNPVKFADTVFTASRKGGALLVNSMIHGTEFDMIV